MLNDAAEELLASSAFALAHWRTLWSTNALERVNGEIKRRANVVGIFPNDATVVHLVPRWCVETHDEEAVAEWRYLSEKSMAKDIDFRPVEATAPRSVVLVNVAGVIVAVAVADLRPHR